MSICSTRFALVLAALGCSLLSTQARAGSFIEIRVNIEINDWSYWLLRDRSPQAANLPLNDSPEAIFPESKTIRCVIGPGTWLMEGDLVQNGRLTEWFTGTNIIERTLITKDAGASTSARLAAISGLAMTSPPVGHTYTRTYESTDGNPGRTIRIPDLLELRSRIAWLAFCSAPVFKENDRKIYPPSDLWKESRLGFFTYPFYDQATTFDDGLGLPRSFTLYNTNAHPVVEYQVAQSTNVLGWNIPTQFYLIQYHPRGTNDWLLLMTAKGKVTSIAPAETPGFLVNENSR
ncbi:MAG TPA: hypothetical protein VHI52_17505 [Verrucomicrobiae bacterium]|nr:hypothetical protein [Verrucomicrobiae bacterium]